MKAVMVLILMQLLMLISGAFAYRLSFRSEFDSFGGWLPFVLLTFLVPAVAYTIGFSAARMMPDESEANS